MNDLYSQKIIQIDHLAKGPDKSTILNMNRQSQHVR